MLDTPSYDSSEGVDRGSSPGTQILNWRVADEDGSRIDIFLARSTTEAYSRTYIQKLIRDGNVSVNGQVVTTPSHQVDPGDDVEMAVPPPRATTLEPEDIPLDVVFEDDDLLVINKQRDLVVHPAPGHYSGTLVHALLHHCGSLSSINNIMRPGIVHRLDKDTTGLMVVAKNDTSHLSLSYQIRKRRMKRVYLALVHGVPEVETGKIEARVGRDPDTRFKMKVVTRGGKHAVTWFRVIEVLDRDHSLLRCELDTGRTHQIRVHLAYIGLPVVGDPMYAEGYPLFGLQGQALHAAHLAFEHPSTGEPLEFDAPMPQDVSDVVDDIRDGLHR